jgi:hypothetical protein
MAALCSNIHQRATMKEQSKINKTLFKSACYKLSLKHLVRRKYVNGPEALAKYIKFYDKTIVSNDIWECISIFDKKNSYLIKPELPRKKYKNKSKKPRKNLDQDDFLRSFEWRKLRMEVLKKYGATCQCCGASRHTGAVINVDHIKPRKYFPELSLEIGIQQIGVKKKIDFIKSHNLS